jgi:hypothetical protein
MEAAVGKKNQEQSVRRKSAGHGEILGRHEERREKER